MFRGMVTILTAAAVLWHTVAGCCAHHGHGGQCCEGSGVARSFADDTASDADHGCCQHAHAESGLAHATESSGQQLSEDSPSRPCPDDGPAGCKESPCVFAALNSSGQSPIDQLDWNGAFSSFAVVEPGIPFCTSRTGDSHVPVGPPPLGGLRLHLAHCMLTL